MIKGQLNVSRGSRWEEAETPFSSPGSRQALGQGVGGGANPRTAWPGAGRLFTPGRGGRGRAGGLLGLYVSRWALGPAGFGDSFRTVSIFWPLERRPRPSGPSPSGAWRPRGPAAQAGLGFPGFGGRLGSVGAGRFGGLPTEDRSLGMVMRGWQMVAKQSPPPPPRPAAPPGLGHGQVHTAAAAWVVAPSPEGWASQPPRVAGGREQVSAPRCPPALASDGARGLLPCAHRFWGLLLQPARLDGGRAPGTAPGRRARRRSSHCLRRRSASSEPRPPRSLPARGPGPSRALTGVIAGGWRWGPLGGSPKNQEPGPAQFLHL